MHASLDSHELQRSKVEGHRICLGTELKPVAKSGLKMAAQQVEAIAAWRLTTRFSMVLPIVKISSKYPGCTVHGLHNARLSTVETRDTTSSHVSWQMFSFTSTKGMSKLLESRPFFKSRVGIPRSALAFQVPFYLHCTRLVAGQLLSLIAGGTCWCASIFPLPAPSLESRHFAKHQSPWFFRLPVLQLEIVSETLLITEFFFQSG